jgi:hypothetical protein
VNPFLDNAQKLFDVARADSSADNTDFALLVRPDGGLHLIMESPLSLEAAAIHAGARTAYRVTRSRDGVRVTGRNAAQRCVLEDHTRSKRVSAELLRDQPLYQLHSPLLESSRTTETLSLLAAAS